MFKRLRSFLSRRIIWIVALSVIWAALLAFNVVPQLRGDYGWRWPYEPMLDVRRLAPLALGILLYVPVALWLRRRSVAGLLTWAIAGGVGLTLATAYVREEVFFRLAAVTLSGGTGGWQMAAARITDIAETLRNWPRFMADSTSFSSHMGISPPGTVVAYYAASAFLARFPSLAEAVGRPLRALQCQNIPLMGETNAQLGSACLGMLAPLWGSLTVLPLYRLGRRAFNQETARWSVVWWPLVPGFLIFAPLPNTFYAFPTLLLIGLLLEGLWRNQPLWIVAAGLLMSALTFLTFTFAPLLLLAGLLTLGTFWLRNRAPETRLPWRWPVQMGLWFGLGLSVVWLVSYALTRLSPWTVLQAATQAHLDLERPYWPWLILHLNDFFMFTGWPVTLLAGAGILAVARRVRRNAAWAESDVVILASG